MNRILPVILCIFLVTASLAGCSGMGRLNDDSVSDEANEEENPSGKNKSTKVSQATPEDPADTEDSEVQPAPEANQ